MTVKELEERTGMPRANIRFYEEEGLLKPKRLDNGYRDYSEEDVLTLEKIKLLRQLQLDIGTIRLVQEGKLSLEQAMFSQLNKLEGDRVLIERAAEVCRGIERSGVEYGALEPKSWLRELEAPTRPQITAPQPKEPPKPTELELHYWSHRACDHPWMRLFARGFDYALYRLAFNALFLSVFRWYGYLDLGWFAETLCSIGIYCVCILLEPFWLHYVGWTPGKWIFGLKIRDKNGEKLSLAVARARAWRVAWKNDGLQIPFYSLWRNWKSYKACCDGEDCDWDWKIHGGCMYTREERKLYGLWWGAGLVLYTVLTVMIFLSILLPRHTNGLTVKEFSENYNDFIGKTRGEYTTLDNQGRWVDKLAEYGYNVVVIDPYEGETVWLDPEFTLENGCVTAVTFRMESDRERVSLDDTRPLLGFLALSGSVKGHSLFNYNYNGWTNAWEENASEYWEDFSFTYRGIQVTQTVDAYGYDGAGPSYYEQQYLSAIEGLEHFVTRTVTISLIGSEVP